MRKMILSITAAAVCLMAGCEKETSTKPLVADETSLGSNQSVTVKPNPDEHPDFETGGDRDQPNTWYDNSSPQFPNDYGCMLLNGGCFNMITIIGDQPIHDFDIVFDAIVGGNDAEIIEEFTNYESTLDDYINTSYVTGVINGDYYVRYKGDWDTEPAYMLFHDSSTEEIEIVHPFEK